MCQNFRKKTGRYNIKKIFLFASILYLTLYIPVSAVLYSSFWYKTNCGWHGRCERVGVERAYQGIDELVSFFRHSSDSLTLPFWSVKEKKHLSEVRGMTDNLFTLALFMLIVAAVSFNQHDARRFSLMNIVLILSLTLILPFFGYFWRHMFHPLLFSNRNWLNTPFDFSYYIMPRRFFKFTLIYLIFSACFLNGLLYGLLRYVNRDTSGD